MFKLSLHLGCDSPKESVNQSWLSFHTTFFAMTGGDCQLFKGNYDHRGLYNLCYSELYKSSKGIVSR